MQCLKYYWKMNRIKNYHKRPSEYIWKNAIEQAAADKKELYTQWKGLCMQTFYNFDEYCLGCFWVNLQIQYWVPNYHTSISKTPFAQVIFHTRHMIRVKYKKVLKNIRHITVIVAKHKFTCQVNIDVRKFQNVCVMKHIFQRWPLMISFARYSWVIYVHPQTWLQYVV